MRYGFNPAYATDGRDSRIFGKIDYSKLRFVGMGTYCLVLTDGTYAIKIGAISHKSIRAMDFAYNQGFSVPVYFYRKSYKLSRKLLDVIYNSKLYSFGKESTRSPDYYVDNGYADIAIVGCAEPLADHETYDYADESDYMILAGRLQREYEYKTGKYWYDAHDGNLGYYKDALVILDF